MWSSSEDFLNQRLSEMVLGKAGRRESLQTQQVLSSVRQRVEPSSPGEAGRSRACFIRAHREYYSEPLFMRPIAKAVLQSGSCLAAVAGMAAIYTYVGHARSGAEVRDAA